MPDQNVQSDEERASHFKDAQAHEAGKPAVRPVTAGVISAPLRTTAKKMVPAGGLH